MRAYVLYKISFTTKYRKERHKSINLKYESNLEETANIC